MGSREGATELVDTVLGMQNSCFGTPAFHRDEASDRDYYLMYDPDRELFRVSTHHGGLASYVLYCEIEQLRSTVRLLVNVTE